GPRYPDMCEPYDRNLIEIVRKIALKEGISHSVGVYAAMLGPSLETRAEYRFLKLIGADCVGMSTVPEVIVGVHCGFKICALSIITDMCLPDALEPVKIEEIIKVANSAQKDLRKLFLGLIKKLK
ncbi:MAG: purine-nucleoside phosphorylase, partial [Planctomycetota bacterium]|nr:purine-nucleoside phosphorylase [Planctomycetota bacterium]